MNCKILSGSEEICKIEQILIWKWNVGNFARSAKVGSVKVKVGSGL